jgi:malonate-semialdehyde dehydrogenase (acetylating)/methylmalonate-semialdehyde dehydrogenase
LEFQVKIQAAACFSKQWTRSYAATAPTTKMFINGKFVESKTNEWIDLHDPATNEVVTRVPKCTQSEMEDAVSAAKEAYRSWSKVSILSRQQIMFKYQGIIKNNMV